MSLTLQAGTVPGETAQVASNQDVINLAVQYIRLVGGDTLTGVVVSETAPSVDQQTMLWAKINSAGDPLGFYRYNGGWTLFPLIIPSSTTALLPSSPTSGQIVWNTDRTTLGGLEVYRNGAWTNRLEAMGSTADRPTTRPNRFRYYDTDIDRWIHWNATESEWTTDDGAVGDTKMVTGVGVSDALARNPGWEEYTALADRSPVGYSTDKPLASTGGRDSFDWSASQRETDQTGDSPFLFNIRIDGQNPTTLHGSNETSDPFTDEFTVDIKNKYLAVLWLRKTVA